MTDVTDFSFRGQRDYLHSSTIFDYLIKSDPRPEKIDFTFHKISDRQCTIMSQTNLGTDDVLVSSYKSEEATCFLYESNTAIQSRYPCNEAAIVEQLQFTGVTASFDMPPIPQASYIESVVGAYKKLLHNSELKFGRKLFFAKLLLRFVPSCGHCGVSHRRKIGGDFFEAELMHDKNEIGKLYFGAK